jgi:hypothetical protein
MPRNSFMSIWYKKAKEEGRLCSRCGWIITVKNWKKGYHLCAGCYFGLKGVNVKHAGGRRLADDPPDKTGEML